LSALRYRQIFSFYWPLVLTSQMMTLAQPIINAALGRGEGAIIQLAGYAVGFGLGVFLNSALFPFQQAVAALGTGPAARRDLTLRILLLGGVICLVDLGLGLWPGSDQLIMTLMGSTPPVADLARKILLVQAPLPLLLPLRSLAWGIIMRNRATRVISMATGLRLAVLTAVVFVTVGHGRLQPAVAGGVAMTVAILVETIFSGFLALRLVRRDAAGVNEGGSERVNWRSFFAFMGPMIVSTVTWSAMRPLLNAVVGRTADPDLAQGGFGFVFPLLILMSSPLWSLNNTALVLIKDRFDLRKVARFSAASIAFFMALIGIWVWTPLRDVLLLRVFALEPDKALYVTTAVILIPYQALPLGLRSLTQGFLMNRRRTGVVATASMIKTVLMVGLGFFAVMRNPGLNGALLGTLLVMFGGTVETGILAWRARRLHHQLILSHDSGRGTMG